jgi:hypothetical protein
VDLLDPDDLDRTAVKEKRGRGYLGLGFRRAIAGDAHWWSFSGELWRLLGNGKSTTGFSTTRVPREFDRRLRLHPDEGGGGGWRSTMAQGASGARDLVVLLQNLARKSVREGAGERERSQGREGKERFTGGAEFHRGGLQIGGVPTTNYSVASR